MKILTSTVRSRVLIVLPCFLFFLAMGSIFKSMATMRTMQDKAASIPVPEPALSQPPIPIEVPQTPEPVYFDLKIISAVSMDTLALTAALCALVSSMGSWVLFTRQRNAKLDPQLIRILQLVFDNNVKIAIDESENRMKQFARDQARAFARPQPARQVLCKSPPVWKPSSARLLNVVQPPTNRRFHVQAVSFEPAKATLPKTSSPPVNLVNEVADAGYGHTAPVTPPFEDQPHELTRDEVISRLAEARVKKYRRVCVPVRGWISFRQLVQEYSITEQEILAAMDKVTVSVDEVCKGDWHAAASASPAVAIGA